MSEDNVNKIVVVSEVLPDKLDILPYTIRPVFPYSVSPIHISGKRQIDIVQKALDKNNKILGFVLVKNEDKRDFMSSELHTVGTAVKIIKVIKIDAENIHIIVQGLKSFRMKREFCHSPIVWDVEYITEDINIDEQSMKPYVLAVMSSLKELLAINKILQEQLKIMMSRISYDKPHIIIDLVAAMLSSQPEQLQDLLETFDLTARIEKLLILLKEEIELYNLQQKIQEEINEKINKQQKEYFLREQLKVIKKELGLEQDDKSAEIEKIQARIKDLVLSEEASKRIQEELDKLNMLEPSSPDFHVTRNYLTELTRLPWGIVSEDNTNLKKAKQILDKKHSGLTDVKERILQFMSTVVRKGTVSGSIICLQGPPGVGKTSIGKSIADALGREFYRFSVGGMKDEAEIKGHRRTYIGAMPGKIIQAIKSSETSNPVIMIDEIDKIGNSYQGDPASALLEVLDPEQNRDFLDHYLDVRFDLSRVLFVTTANQLDTIPRPLLDRMEVITLSGYIMEEKLEIAKKHLIPRQLEAHALEKKELSFTDKGLRFIIDRYAREAGVRSLDNHLQKVMRKVSLNLAMSNKTSYRITEKNAEKFLGKPRFNTETLYEREIPGVTLGLAWTAMGGATLYIEATAIRGKDKGFKQTGKLGEVMKESSQIAHTYVRSLLCKTDGNCFLEDNAIHLHVPEGATPKDGPSAGVTMSLALYSLATGKAVRKGIAMTGEITLTGKVLPVGGIREKTIAARRVGVYELMFPKENQKDFEELPDYIKEGITAHFVDYFEDVLKIVY